MSDDFVEYWLPTSVLRAKGTVTRRVDGLFPKKAATVSAAAELTLDTVADKDVPRGGAHPLLCVARIRHGLFSDTNARFELTDDRRLVTAGAGSGGQAGKVVLGVVGAAATVASLAAGFAPGAVAGATAMARAARDYERFAPGNEAALRDSVVKNALSDEERVVETAFLDEQPQVALARLHFRELALRLLDQLREALSAVERAGTVEDRHRRAIARVVSCQKALGVARGEVARLDAIFAAWRASKIDESVEQVDVVVPIADVVATRPDDEGWGPMSPRVVELLQKFGVWAVAEDLEAKVPSKAFDESVITLDNGRRIASGVILRQPRTMMLAIYQYTVAGKPAPWTGDPDKLKCPLDAAFRLVERRMCFVVDRDSRHEFIEFRSSLWGRKTVDVSLSPLGGLKSYKAASGSAAAAAAETAAALPGTVRDALDDVAKMRSELDALRDRSLDLQIADIKKRIDLKNQELLLSGVDATESDLAEIERLRQEQAILEARVAVQRIEAELTA